MWLNGRSVVDHSPSMYKALSLTPSRKNERQRQRREAWGERIWEERGKEWRKGGEKGKEFWRWCVNETLSPGSVFKKTLNRCLMLMSLSCQNTATACGPFSNLFLSSWSISVRCFPSLTLSLRGSGHPHLNSPWEKVALYPNLGTARTGSLPSGIQGEREAKLSTKKVIDFHAN